MCEWSTWKFSHGNLIYILFVLIFTLTNFAYHVCMEIKTFLGGFIFAHFSQNLKNVVLIFAQNQQQSLSYRPFKFRTNGCPKLKFFFSKQRIITYVIWLLENKTDTNERKIVWKRRMAANLDLTAISGEIQNTLAGNPLHLFPRFNFLVMQ